MTNTLTRRGFGLASLGTMVALTTACPAWLSSIYTDIKNYAPTILAAVASVMSILTGAGVISIPLSAVISGVISLISKAVGDLQTAVNNYQSAPAAQKSTLVGAITTALADAEANIQQFWSDLSIPDAQLETTIKNLLGVIISTLSGYINSLKVTPALSQSQIMRAQLSKTIQVTPQRRTLAQFKSDFNAQLPLNLKQHSL